MGGLKPTLVETMLKIVEARCFWSSCPASPVTGEQQRQIGWNFDAKNPHKGTAAVKRMPEFAQLLELVQDSRAWRVAEDAFSDLWLESTFPNLRQGAPSVRLMTRTRYGCNVIFTKNQQSNISVANVVGNVVVKAGSEDDRLVYSSGRVVPRFCGESLSPKDSSLTVGLLFQRPTLADRTAFFSIEGSNFSMTDGIMVIFDGSSTRHGAWSSILGNVPPHATWYGIFFVDRKP